jgi:hypothetical protein
VTSTPGTVAPTGFEQALRRWSDGHDLRRPHPEHLIDGATHQDLITDEEDAAATTQAILDVVSAVRDPRRLVS